MNEVAYGLPDGKVVKVLFDEDGFPVQPEVAHHALSELQRLGAVIIGNIIRGGR